MEVNVKYFNKNSTPLQLTYKGDLIDLRIRDVCRELFLYDVHGKLASTKLESINMFDSCFSYNKGDVLKIKLGVAMKLPDGYKANLYPRSSTFKNYGWLLTNSVGQIDNSYCGDNDEWCAEVYCTRSGICKFDERAFQFEIVPSMKITCYPVNFNTVDKLDNEDRGGYGTSGVE